MKSLVVKRSIVIDGHSTSVTVEEAFWKGLHKIAHERDMGLNRLIASINRNRQCANLSSAIRLFVLEYYRDQHEPEQAVTVSQPEGFEPDRPPGRATALDAAFR
jgi:predicted DNA-binding ribbon-helix-helix protein